LRRKEGGLQRRWGRLIGFSGNQAWLAGIPYKWRVKWEKRSSK
jgi:hypothetical protein